MRRGDFLLLLFGCAVGLMSGLLGSSAIPVTLGFAVLIAALAGALAKRMTLVSIAAGLSPLAYLMTKRVIWEIQTRGNDAVWSVIQVILLPAGFVLVCWLTAWLTVRGFNRSYVSHRNKEEPR